jgi:hypothetical protein
MTTVGGKFTAQKRNLVTYIDAKQYELLRELAERRGSSVSAQAAAAIQHYLRQQLAELEQPIAKN